MSNFNLSTVHLIYPEAYPATRYEISNTNTNTEHVIKLYSDNNYIHISTVQIFKLHIDRKAYSTIILAENITGNEVLTYLKLLHEIGSTYPTQVLQNLYNLLGLDYEEF